MPTRPVGAFSAIASVLTLLLSACSSPAEDQLASVAPSDVEVWDTTTDHGFSFANFTATSYEEEVFNADDMITMFGSGGDVCVTGSTADDCVLSAEAAQFASMVNTARSWGHCEGFSVVAANRYNDNLVPVSYDIPDNPEVLHAFMRGVASQFIPEVQAEADAWSQRSLRDKVLAVQSSLDAGELSFSLGLYTETSGHALLPYAVTWENDNRASVWVYDSNRPGEKSFVDVDLNSGIWNFTYSDGSRWSGDYQMMDLASVSGRYGKCPFCSDAIELSRASFYIRSESPHSSVAVNGQSVPAGTVSDTVSYRPMKGSGNGGENFSDPLNVGGFIETGFRYRSYGSSFTAADSAGRAGVFYTRVAADIPEGTEVSVSLPDASLVFIVTDEGLHRFSTLGGASLVVDKNGVSSSGGELLFVSGDSVVELRNLSGQVTNNLDIEVHHPATGDLLSLKLPSTAHAVSLALDREDSQRLLATYIGVDGSLSAFEIRPDGSRALSDDVEWFPTREIEVDLAEFRLEREELITSFSVPQPDLPSTGDGRDEEAVNGSTRPPTTTTTVPPTTTTTTSTTVPPTTTVPPATTTTTVPPTTTTTTSTTVPPTTTTTTAPPTTTTSTTVPPTSTTTTTTVPPTTTTSTTTTSTTTVPPTTTTTTTSTTVPPTTTTTTVPPTTTTTTTIPSTTTTTTTTTTTVPPLYATASLDFDANGGQNAPQSVVDDPGATVSIAASSPTRSGFSFSGWNTSSDGLGSVYEAGADYILPPSNGDTDTLYAQWNSLDYSYVAGTPLALDGSLSDGSVVELDMEISPEERLIFSGSYLQDLLTSFSSSSSAESIFIGVPSPAFDATSINSGDFISSIRIYQDEVSTVVIEQNNNGVSGDMVTTSTSSLVEDLAFEVSASGGLSRLFADSLSTAFSESVAAGFRHDLNDADLSPRPVYVAAIGQGTVLPPTASGVSKISIPAPTPDLVSYAGNIDSLVADSSSEVGHLAVNLAGDIFSVSRAGDAWLSKHNSAGVEQWRISTPVTGDAHLAPASDGGVYVGGLDPVSNQAGVAKVSADGQVVWSEFTSSTVGAVELHGIDVLDGNPDSGVIFVGKVIGGSQTLSLGSLSVTVPTGHAEYFAHLGPDGSATMLDASARGDAANFRGFSSVDARPDGNGNWWIAVGSIDPPTVTTAPSCARFTYRPQLTPPLVADFECVNLAFSRDVALLSDGSVIAVSYLSGTAVELRRYAISGQTMWSASVVDDVYKPFPASGRGLDVDDNDGIYFAARRVGNLVEISDSSAAVAAITISSADPNGLLMKFSSEGSYLWSRVVGSGAPTKASSVVVSGNEVYLAASGNSATQFDGVFREHYTWKPAVFKFNTLGVSR